MTDCNQYSIPLDIVKILLYHTFPRPLVILNTFSGIKNTIQNDQWAIASYHNTRIQLSRHLGWRCNVDVTNSMQIQNCLNRCHKCWNITVLQIRSSNWTKHILQFSKAFCMSSSATDIISVTLLKVQPFCGTGCSPEVGRFLFVLAGIFPRCR